MRRCRTARWCMPVNREYLLPRAVIWRGVSQKMVNTFAAVAAAAAVLRVCRFYQMTGYGADEVLGHNW